MACAVLAVAGGVIAAPHPVQARDGVAVDRLVLRPAAWVESPALGAGSEGRRGPRPRGDHRELPVAEPVLALRVEHRINTSGLADLVWSEALAGSAMETPARLGTERVQRVFDTRRH